MSFLTKLLPAALTTISVLLVAVYVSRKLVLALLGRHYRHKARMRRAELQMLAAAGNGQSKKSSVRGRDWEGIIGFFHPFCNAAGGGERVLWAAIKATQERFPRAVCIVYTGDVGGPGYEGTGGGGASGKERILDKAEANFNIPLHRPLIHFQPLRSRSWLLASRYPYFTLLGQSLGSLLVAHDAFSQCVPDVFIDTMGYSFVTAFASFVLPDMPLGAYVHYPTISTDMLGSLDGEEGKRGARESEKERGLNAGRGKGTRGWVKKHYWRLFARLYGWTGQMTGRRGVMMANSSWTGAHLRTLWGGGLEILFPPVSVGEIEAGVEIGERGRERILLYIAQFRPEKNHGLILEAFAELLGSSSLSGRKGVKLVLIGSIRDDNAEDVARVEALKQRVKQLGIENQVQFACNAPWKTMLDFLARSSIGVNGMWNEHFGIGVVEYQAAGLICVANDSGGPKLDIVVDVEGKPTGYHASTATEYATAFEKALSLPPAEALAMRRRARKSARRFGEEAFAKGWVKQVEKLVDMLPRR